MALGTFGSTLSDELNRLANGGTYRTMASMVDDALAAKQWANRENINPYSTDTVGVLNEIAGLGLDKKNWLDFNGVCNYIAGTTGLPAAAALRQVYPTTDLLTGVASYYVDATAPTNWGSLGYVRLNGVTGNFLSVPDANALDITGDLDVRVQVAMDDWTPGAFQTFIGKWNETTQKSFIFDVSTTGTLRLVTSVDGSATTVNASSTVAPTIADGQPLWVRVTLDVDNGASGRDITFYTSTNGTTWTQLGTTVTQAGTTSIFNSTAPVTIGSYNTTSNTITGNFYRAQVLNGIGGTTVLDVNIATDYRSSNQSFFTATTGQTVTVNGVDTIANLGAAGSLLPTTLGSSTAADSNDPKFLDFTGTNYVYLPGVLNNNLSLPDANDLDITGDIDVRAYVALDDWTPSASQDIFSKWGAAGNYSWVLRIASSTGIPNLFWSNDGTTILSAAATVAPTITDGSALWIRATLDVDNGASGKDVKFFTSTNGTTWTQLGSTVTTASTTSIFASNATVIFGASSISTTNTSGKVFRAQIYNGIDGTKVLDVDTSVITAGSQTSFTAATGQTVTINRSTSGRKTVAVTQPTWLFGTDDYMEVNNRYMSSGTYLYLPGVSTNYASAPDSAALDITGDIDLRVKVALDDWTPAAEAILITKSLSTGNQRGYYLYLFADGKLGLYWSTDGINTVSATSSVTNGITDGATKWVRATLDVDNGAAGYDVKFYTSDDAITWTQLGTTITGVGTTSIYANTSVLSVGSSTTGAVPARGKFFRAQVLNGINGTVAFDANFETSITSLLQTSFTESSANAATVTINRSGSAYRSAGITTAGYLYPGATNTFTASAIDYLNFGASDSFTAIVVSRQANYTATQVLLSKTSSLTAPGYFVRNASGSPATLTGGFTDPTTQVSISGGTRTAGALVTASMVRNVSTDNGIVYTNSTAGTAATDTTTGALTSIENLSIGKFGSGGNYADMEFVAAAIFRRALTASQVRQISNYFANREVYL